MSELWQDVRFALRNHRRRWGITLVAVFSLSVAIGGNTAVFSLVSQILFAPTSVTEPERVVVVQERRRDQSVNLSTFTTSLPIWADLAERSRSTLGWAAVRTTSMGLRGPERSEPVSGAAVTQGFFELVGVAPRRGRAFRPEEGVEGGPRVAVVRPEFWARRGSGEDPLGRTLVLDGEPHRIVGVLPPDFRFLFSNVDVWVPLTDNPREAPRDRRDVLTLARLSPGATTERFEAEMEALTERFAEENPATFEAWTLDVFNFKEDIPPSQTKLFYGLLQGTVFFVLLIACANIANLLMARGQERRREIALRTVLGAGRGRIIRQLLTESATLVAAGLAVGLPLGWYGTRLLAEQFRAFNTSFVPSLNGQVVLFTVAVAGLAGLLFGVAPALQTFRGTHTDALKEGSKGSAGRSRRLVSRALVVGEIALSLVALGGGGMLMKSFLDLRNVDPGFEAEGLLAAQARMPPSRLADDEARVRFLDRLLARADGLGGVTAAAVVNTLPQSFAAPTDSFRVGSGAGESGARAPQAFALTASPRYLEAMGVELLQGRFFEPGDRLGAAPVAVVNRSLAEAHLPRGDAIGAQIFFRGESREVVGVVDDVLQVLIQTPGGVQSEAVYLPAAQSPTGAWSLVLRAQGDPDALSEPLREALQELDRDLTVRQLLTMPEVNARNFAGIDIFNTILGTFGVLAILLAALGTYGVLAYSVSQRRREIGIRMAIGQRGGSVVRMVAWQGVGMALLGLALGGLMLVPLLGLLRSLMQGLSSVEPGAALAVAALLFSVTLAASLVPAWRAARLDPVTALRDE